MTVSELTSYFTKQIYALIKTGQSKTIANEILQSIEEIETPQTKQLFLAIAQLLTKLSEAHDFINGLSGGRLDMQIPARNMVVSPFKQLHANLSHLVWQVQRISEGDYNHEIDFLGDFSLYFNKLIQSLKEKQRVENQLKISEEKYRLITENASDVIWILNLTQQKYTYISPSVYTLRGFTPEEAMQQDINQSLTPESAKIVLDSIAEFLPLFLTNPTEMSKKIHRHELQQTCKDGSIIWIETATHYQLNKNNEIEVIGISRNIEERKRFEKLLEREARQLKDALETKEVLLKEVHHRVKNNLQTISSLLYQQQTLSNDPKIADALRDSMNRVSSMALIHQFIYKSDDLQNINMKNYINDLVGKLANTYRERRQNVQVNMEIDEIYFDIEKTIPVALIINEVLSNIFKYAFTGKESGIVNVKLTKMDNEKNKLEISDNGTGFPEDFRPEKSKSLGMYLIKNFAKRQLKGTLQITSKPEEGVKYEIKF